MTAAPAGLPRVPPLSGVLHFSMGWRVFFALRGRAYSARKLPLMLDGTLRALAIAVLNTRPDQLDREYFQILRRIARILNRHCVPTTRLRRLFWLLRLLPNPFLRARERELLEIIHLIAGQARHSDLEVVPRDDLQQKERWR